MVLLLFIWPSSFCLIHCRSKYLLLYGTLWYNMVLYGTIMVCVDQLYITMSFNLSWFVYNFVSSFLILTNLSIPSTLLPRATCRGYLFIYFVKIYSIFKIFCLLLHILFVSCFILPFSPQLVLNRPYILAVLDLLLYSFSIIELLLAPASSLSSNLSWAWPSSAPACLANFGTPNKHNKHLSHSFIHSGATRSVFTCCSRLSRTLGPLGGFAFLLVTPPQTYPNQTVRCWPVR